MDTRFDAELLRRYGGRGPRYTSYPTAVQFDESLTADDYASNAMASNATALPLSLYVHIPFCHALCYYCGCNKIVTRNADRVARYLDRLQREIELQADLFDPARATEQLHFGGGTPTYLDTIQLQSLMQQLDRHFPFASENMREFSIEVDPRTVDADRIAELAMLGFNRLSMGVQDFDERVQRAVNRVQSVDEVERLTASARQCGFRSISFDLIYGLPQQTVASFSKTLDRAIDMRPDRLAVYNYAHLPERFKGQRMISPLDIPAADVKLDILQRTIERLDRAGYLYVGMDHFALPEDDLVHARSEGTLQRNFQGYSTHRDCDLIGLGVSSISRIGNVYAQNAATTMDYEALIDAGRLPVNRGCVADADDQHRAAVIQALMCYDGLRFADFNDVSGIDFKSYFASELESLQPLAADGLLTLDDDGIALTPAGRLLLRNVAMAFDRYLDGADNRYSKAI